MKTKILHTLQKTVIVTMVMLLAFSGAAMAEDTGALTNPTTAADGAKFSDIPAGYWAEKYVKKLALLGVVSGSNGMFKPKDNISREEAAIMAVGLMGLKAEAEAKADHEMLALTVSDWAKKYVLTAISHQVLSLPEELSGSDLLSPWGKDKATREWVAKLAVRAIGQEAEAVSLQSQRTDFTDDAAISDNARGYINEAVKLDIIKGKTDGSFDPKGNITRAEMAVMFSNAEQYLSQRSDQIVSGTVQEIDSQTLKVQKSDGSVVTLNLTADTAYYKHDSNLRIFSSEVKQYYQVTVVQADGNAYYVEVTDDQIQYETVKGTLISVSLSDRNLIMQVNGETKVFPIVPNVMVKDQDGSGMSLSELQANSQIAVMKSALDANASVVQITVEKVPVVAQVQGKVVSVDLAAVTVTVKDEAGGTSSYGIPGNVPLKYGDQTLADLSGLHIGDSVSLHLTDGAVDAFELVSSDYANMEGTVDIIDPSGQSVYVINQDHTRTGYGVAKNAKIFIQGLPDATLIDLQKGDSIRLEVNKNTNEVLNITVLDRQVNTGLNYTIFGYDTGSKQVVLKDKDSKFLVYEMNDKTKIEMYGSEIGLDSFATTFTKDKKVDITYTGDRLIAIRMTNTYTGTISKLDPSAKTVTIETDNYGSLTFGYLISSGVQVFGQSNTSLADLHIGDIVKVQLDGDQEKVLLFQRMDTLIFKVTGTSLYDLFAQNESGTQYDLYTGGNVEVTNADHFPMNLSSIKIGDYITALFEGQTLKSVQLANVTRGIVKNIGTNGTLTIFEYGGSNKTIVLQGGVKVALESSVSTSLTSLKVNDRAEVVSDPKAGTLIRIIPGIQKNFFKYDAQNNVIMVKKVTLSEQYQFNLTSNAYIHQGDQTLNLSSLANNDPLMIYMVDGKIAEINKLNP